MSPSSQTVYEDFLNYIKLLPIFNLAGMYPRLDRSSITFDLHICGNLVTTNYDLGPIFSPNLPV